MTETSADEEQPASADAPSDPTETSEPIETDEKNEKEAKGGGERRAEPEWDGAEEVRDLRRTFYVQNNFHAGVHTEHGVFGVHIGEQVSVTARGDLDLDRVAEDLRGFVPPSESAKALELLREHRLVVLVGPEDSGKRALALHLLRTVCGPGAPLSAESPLSRLGQLADLKFVEGAGYVVTDHLVSGENATVRSYEAERVSAACEKHTSHLVLTTTSKRMGERYLRPYAITVAPPDPVKVLHGHLGEAVIDADILTMAEQYVSTNRGPRSVASLARRMASDPTGAVAAMREGPREEVSTWFDGRISVRQLLSITTLAIGGNQPEPIHDLLLDMLRAHVVSAQEHREAAPHVSWQDEVPHQRERNHPLITVVAGDDLDDEEGWLAGRRVRFRHDGHREHVLRELYDRYDHQLWHPVRSWLHELCRLDPRVELRNELAWSLTLLARENFVEIRDGYLYEWAGGLAAERRTAAMVLWFMSYDDRLAPVALRTALEWGQNKGLNRAVTSALALGGPLGIRFPDEAMRRLCFLALRAKRIGDVARVAMGGLFAVAVADGSAATGRVLSTVHTELVRAVDPHRMRAVESDDEYMAARLADDQADEGADLEEYERGWTGRVAKAARSMVLALLRAEQVDETTLVTTRILREQPEHVDLLGRLWAEVLCSAPHRADAIEALVETLRSLADEQDVTNAVSGLGVAMYAAMPAPHRPLRTAELVRAMGNSGTTEQPLGSLANTLLSALSVIPQPTRS